MKDLVEKALPYLPRYLTELGRLLTGPKRFIAKRDLRSDETFAQALVFAAVSIVLTVVATMPLYPGKDVWGRMGAWAVGCIVNGALLSLALRIAWRAVGGNAPLRSFFVAYAYFYGALAILFAASLLLFAGLLRGVVPNVHAWFVQQLGAPLSIAAFRDGQMHLELTRAEAGHVLWIAAVFIASQLGLAAWTVVAWGAFRELNRASRARSAVALLIASLLAVPSLLAGVFVTNAMT